MVDPARVAGAAAAWIWVPDGAPTHETDDFLLVRYPEWFVDPVGLMRMTTTRPVGEVLDEALAAARTLAAETLVVWVRLDAPAGLEDELRASGGEPDETLDVFGLDLDPTAGGPALDPAADATLTWVGDMATLRDHGRVGVAAFGGQEPPEDTLAPEAERLRATWAAGTGGSVVAYVDGRPVASGGLTLADGVARLWGGGVVEDARGRGLYRAVLAERLAYAVQHGATLALVKGRVQTSGPILRRAGFEVVGQERSYRLRLA